MACIRRDYLGELLARVIQPHMVCPQSSGLRSLADLGRLLPFEWVKFTAAFSMFPSPAIFGKDSPESTEKNRPENFDAPSKFREHYRC